MQKKRVPPVAPGGTPAAPATKQSLQPHVSTPPGVRIASLDGLGDETLLRLTDVAHILAEDYSTSYRRVSTGDVPSIRLGARSLRVRAGDLRAYLAARERRRDDSVPTPWGARHAS